MTDQTRVLDREAALSRIGGDEDLLREIAALFLDDYPSLEERIRKALLAGDAEELQRASHTLKGAVANFAAEQAYQCALELETIGRSRDLSRAGDAFDRMLQAFAMLHPEMRALASEGA